MANLRLTISQPGHSVFTKLGSNTGLLSPTAADSIRQGVVFQNCDNSSFPLGEASWRRSHGSDCLAFTPTGFIATSFIAKTKKPEAQPFVVSDFHWELNNNETVPA
jgi:hypothetical protein